MLAVTIRNAKRLHRLTNDVLDVTKIEGKSLELKKEEFNLNDVLINAMNDITLGRDFLNNENIQTIRRSSLGHFNTSRQRKNIAGYFKSPK